MSINDVRQYLKNYQKDNEVLELDKSSATVELAAQALNVIPARIAKTLSFKKDDSCILVVTAGDTKIDNKKFKQTFGFKAKMLTPEEVINLTGHAIGGVCPFALKNETIFPACGGSNSAIELSCDELFEISKSEKWVDVCSLKE